jgi:C4-dicarboxylate transporter DctM subunit
MNALTASAIAFAAVLFLSALRVPLAFALGIVGAGGVALLRGTNTLLYVVGTAPFEVLNNYSLSVLPMFVLMGALAVRTGLAADLVRFANGCLGHRQGGLAMASVIACAGFGAVSGSNLATLSTMSKITVPEMLRHGYHPKLAAGTLASASTLDILIPPSIPMVIYATMTESSIGRMLAGGIVPGVILTLLFIIAIRIWVSLNPFIAPAATSPLPFAQRLKLVRGVWGVSAVFILMMAGMYAGFFSPTEAAAVGAFGILVVGLIEGRMTWPDLVSSVRETVHISAIIFLILVGIEMFHFLMDSVGLQRELTAALNGTKLPAWVIMTMIIVGLILLGCVMDATSILFITTPLLYPVVIALGYDGIWFGVIMIMLIQLGLIHPPFGLNVFIMASLLKEVKIGEAFWGCVPFVIADILMIGACLAAPQIILWLPNAMFN